MFYTFFPESVKYVPESVIFTPKSDVYAHESARTVRYLFAHSKVRTDTARYTESDVSAPKSAPFLTNL